VSNEFWLDPPGVLAVGASEEITPLQTPNPKSQPQTPNLKRTSAHQVSSSSSVLLSSLELSDTKVYEPEIRAHLGTIPGVLAVGAAEEHHPRQARGPLAGCLAPPTGTIEQNVENAFILTLGFFILTLGV